MRNFKRFNNNTCIHCLAVNRDVKFQVDNFIRFMKDGLDLKKAKTRKGKCETKASLPKQKN